MRRPKRVWLHGGSLYFTRRDRFTRQYKEHSPHHGLLKDNRGPEWVTHRLDRHSERQYSADVTQFQRVQDSSMLPRQRFLLGIDIGGTSVRVALAESPEHILGQQKLASPAQEEPAAMVETIGNAARELLRAAGNPPLEAVGLAAPGSIDILLGHVANSPNLPLYHDVPLRDLVARELGAPVVMDNDANAAALAEHYMGSGQGVQEMVYVTVSTGIGTGIITRGRLIHGARGGAGEAGHTTIKADGPTCSCGRRGCWEALASGKAVAREATRRLQAREESTLAATARERPNGIDAQDVRDAARRGDRMSQAVLDDASFYLGVGLANLVNTLNPELIVVGGGLTQMGDALVAPAFNTCRELAFPLHNAGLRLEVTRFGDDVALRGALILAQDLAAKE